MFIDHINVKVQAGDGGNGCESYLRRTDRKIVPDGGDGGRGGRIIFRADTNAPPLTSLRFRQHIVAENGGHGSGSRKRGKKGKDTEVLVPVGTRIYNREKNFLIRDLADNGENVVVAAGGEGGVGNDGGKEATRGEKGDILELEICFRIQADVFFVGMPNSGRSKLMNMLTGTHAKSEPYPFASRHPEIGVYAFSEYEKITLCDLPSLYEGSDKGRGHGRRFLSHLENARFLFYVVDPVSDFSDSLQSGLEILKRQVETYNNRFVHIASGVLVTKADLPEARQRFKASSFDPDMPCFFISSENGDGIKKLKDFLKTRVLENSDAGKSHTE